MTQEQEIRGRDGTVHSALFVTGYDEAAVAALARDELAPERFVAHGAAPTEYGSRLYRQSYALTAADIRAAP
jgi:hypothetical protein